MVSLRTLSLPDVLSIRPARFYLCSAILLVLGAGPIVAQNVATGAVSGQVTDQQGAAIPGGTVKLTELSTNTPKIQAWTALCAHVEFLYESAAAS